MSDWNSFRPCFALKRRIAIYLQKKFKAGFSRTAKAIFECNVHMYSDGKSIAL